MTACVKINTCRLPAAGRFADHKEKGIDLLRRVCTVSVGAVMTTRTMESTTR